MATECWDDVCATCGADRRSHRGPEVACPDFVEKMPPPGCWVPASGPLDGRMATYAFSPCRKGRDARSTCWEVDATSLARAIRLFYVGCPLAHTYSETRIVSEERIRGVERGYDGGVRYLSSGPGARVFVFARLKGARGEDGGPIAAMPVEGAEVEQAMLELQAHGFPGAEEGAGTALVRATASTGMTAAPKTDLDRRSLDLQRSMDALEAQKAALALQVGEIAAELKRRMEQVWLIELFLGSKEDVVVLRQGQAAGVEEPIHVRQATLCMDEEIVVHDWLNDPDRIGNFSAADLEAFDTWLLDDAALDAICPWQKGIVALRVRRTDKHRPELDGAGIAGAFRRMSLQELDRMTYLLIRNGRNLYRLWIDVRLWPRLVPRAEDLEVQGTWGDGRVGPGDSDRAVAARKQIGAGLLAITGICQRSTLLHPLPRGDINAFDPGHVEAYFRIVYDDEGRNLLGDGRRHEHLTWKGYRDWLRGRVTAGCRVFWTRPGGSSRGIDKLRERTHGMGHSWPERDVAHTIDRAESGWQGYAFSFLYNGSYRRTPGARRTRFHCFGDEVVPIDLMSWRVLEHLIRDRGQRQEYGQFFRLAFDYWKLAKAEAAQERPFIDLVLTQAGVGLDDEAARARAERLLRWWRLKTKAARTLGSDEPKALRMVLRAFTSGQDYDDDPETRLMEST